MLVKKVSIDSFVYIQKISFQMVDYKGLKQLQIIVITEHNKEQIQSWLSECEDIYGIIKNPLASQN